MTALQRWVAVFVTTVVVACSGLFVGTSASGAPTGSGRVPIIIPQDWYTVTRPFDYDSRTPFRRGAHRGVDVRPVDGQVRAIAPGIVHFAGHVAGRSIVSIRSKDPVRGSVVVTYVDVDSRTTRGSRVELGQRLGRVRRSSIHIGVRDQWDRWRYYAPAVEAPRASGVLAEALGQAFVRVLEAPTWPDFAPQPANRNPRVGQLIASQSAARARLAALQHRWLGSNPPQGSVRTRDGLRKGIGDQAPTTPDNAGAVHILLRRRYVPDTAWTSISPASSVLSDVPSGAGLAAGAASGFTAGVTRIGTPTLHARSVTNRHRIRSSQRSQHSMSNSYTRDAPTFERAPVVRRGSPRQRPRSSEGMHAEQRGGPRGASRISSASHRGFALTASGSQRSALDADAQSVRVVLVIVTLTVLGLLGVVAMLRRSRLHIGQKDELPRGEVADPVRVLIERMPILVASNVTSSEPDQELECGGDGVYRVPRYERDVRSSHAACLQRSWGGSMRPAVRGNEHEQYLQPPGKAAR